MFPPPADTGRGPHEADATGEAGALGRGICRASSTHSFIYHSFIQN